jgi:hypothetical protein
VQIKVIEKSCIQQIGIDYADLIISRDYFVATIKELNKMGYYIVEISWWQHKRIGEESHYLNLDGTKRICDFYNEPEEDVSPCRVVFFNYKNESKLLKTPYGSFKLKDDIIPDRLKKIIEFEDND